MPIAPALRSSASDDWPTPQAFFDMLDAEFDFEVDLCASSENAKCPLWFGPDHPDPDRRDGLAQDWSGLRGWCNPPYGRGIGAWMRKAVEAAAAGSTIVCLVPARTDTRWFQDYLIDTGAELRFVRGRLTFGDGPGPAPFPSVVAVLRPPPTANATD
jgi:phage N-6-adenine-methyltransferase